MIRGMQNPVVSRTSVRKVPRGMAQAATPPSWKILRRTSTLKGSIHRPLYSTCVPLPSPSAVLLPSRFWGGPWANHLPASMDHTQGSASLHRLHFHPLFAGDQQDLMDCPWG